CPEPVEGWCDCDKCKSMIFHKEKNIYVCLSCHKQTEPFLPIDWNSNDYDWLPYEDEY
ncbi:exodeoxyribonuclease V subunit beta, partial [Salmonella enterica]|nr:exodeoxyribonuclease V subunit beta [Salmonella enterica]